MASRQPESEVINLVEAPVEIGKLVALTIGMLFELELDATTAAAAALDEPVCVSEPPVCAFESLVCAFEPPVCVSEPEAVLSDCPLVVALAVPWAPAVAAAAEVSAAAAFGEESSSVLVAL